MKKNILTYSIIIILCCSNVMLLIKERKNKVFLQQATQLINSLTEDACAKIDFCFSDYDWLKEDMNEDIDNYMSYIQQNPQYSSEDLKTFFIREARYNSETEKQMFALLALAKKSSKEKYLFMQKCIDFLFITRMERRNIENMCLFDAVSVNVSAIKDTILKGEEYVANIGYSASFYQTIPTMVIDGDTVSTIRGDQTFKETPNKKGNVKHDCMITYNWQGRILEMPFTIEYYVK